MRYFVFLSVLLTILASCSSIKPVPPDLPAAHINPSPLPDSKIDVPVTIDLSQVFNDLNSTVASSLSGEGSAGPAQYRWTMQRQPFNLSFTGDSLNISDNAHFDAGGYIKNPLNGKWTRICSCNADAAIGIIAGFNFSNDYLLSGNVILKHFDLSACNLDIASLNITPLIKTGATAEINKAIAELNNKIKGYNFRSLIQPPWQQLCQPIKIADIGYIVINPSAVRLAHPVGDGNLLSLSAGITAKPVFYLSNPGTIAASPLPNISDSRGNGFNLNMDIHLDYKPLNTLLNNAVQNQKITNGTKGYLIIRNAEIFGSGNEHLLIKVNFTGKEGAIPYHGMLYFTCMPLYDANNGNMYVDEINFDVNTISKLKEGPAMWLLGSALKKYIGSQIHFNISGQVNNLKNKLNESLNRRINPHLTLSGKVDTLALRSILPVKDFIMLRFSTSGNLSAKVN